SGRKTWCSNGVARAARLCARSFASISSGASRTPGTRRVSNLARGDPGLTKCAASSPAWASPARSGTRRATASANHAARAHARNSVQTEFLLWSAVLRTEFCVWSALLRTRRFGARLPHPVQPIQRRHFVRLGERRVVEDRVAEVLD